MGPERTPTARNGRKALYSCETCRRRKVRCKRQEGYEAPASPTGRHVERDLGMCIPCVGAKLECVTQYERSKRGPHGPHKHRAQKEDSASASPTINRSGTIQATDSFGPAPMQPPLEGPMAFAEPPISSLSGCFDLFSSPMISAPSAGPSTIVAGESLSFTSIVSMDFVIYVSTLHFEYVWPLIPLLHRPTFMKQLEEQKDHPNPQFFSLLMSLLALSLIQIPKSLIPETTGPVSQLATRCFEASRSVSLSLYDPPSVDLAISRYYDSAFNTLMGRRGASVTAHGEATKLVVLLGLHKEETYAGLDPVETEIRRRVFSMIYYTDKSSAFFWNQTITLRAEDCDAHLPKAIDDENLDQTGYHWTNQERFPVITCHNIAYHLFDLIGRVMDLRKALDMKTSQTVDLTSLGKLANLCTQLQTLVKSLPPELALSTGSAADTSPQVMLFGDFVQPASSSITSTFPVEPPASYMNWNGFSSDVKKTPDVLLPQKGNIHATIAVARLLIISARDAIRDSGGPALSIGQNAMETVMRLNHQDLAAVNKLDVVTDLVQVLRTIPVVSLAVNSHSLINKLKFTANALLPPGALHDPLEFMLGDLHPDKMALVEILMILTDIDQNLVER